MRAALFTGVHDQLLIEDVTLGAPGPFDVLVRIGASGVCHSDLSVVDGGRPLVAPAILGHEAAGTVEAIGVRVSRVQVGDRVIASFIPSCGECFWCRHEQSNLCSKSADFPDFARVTRTDGSTATAYLGLGTFAEQMVVHESSVVSVRTELPDDQLALLGCGVTTGVCAVLNSAKVEAGASVAVVGCGGVGQAVIQGAVIAGAVRIIAVDPVALKRNTALVLGATDVVDPAVVDPLDAVAALTSGLGVDYAFEATGHPHVTRQAFMMTRRGGAVIMLGMPRFDAELRLPALPLFAEGKRVFGSKYGDAQVRRAFQMLIDLTEAGRLNLEALVSRRIALHEVNDALRAIQDGEVIRSVIV